MTVEKVERSEDDALLYDIFRIRSFSVDVSFAKPVRRLSLRIQTYREGQPLERKDVVGFGIQSGDPAERLQLTIRLLDRDYITLGEPLEGQLEIITRGKVEPGAHHFGQRGPLLKYFFNMDEYFWWTSFASHQPIEPGVESGTHIPIFVLIGNRIEPNNSGYVARGVKDVSDVFEQYPNHHVAVGILTIHEEFE